MKKLKIRWKCPECGKKHTFKVYDIGLAEFISWIQCNKCSHEFKGIINTNDNRVTFVTDGVNIVKEKYEH